jgi:hypothetical protein
MAEVLPLHAAVAFTTGCAITDWEATPGLMSRLLGRMLLEVAVFLLGCEGVLKSLGFKSVFTICLLYSF